MTERDFAEDPGDLLTRGLIDLDEPIDADDEAPERPSLVAAAAAGRVMARLVQPTLF